MKDKLPITNKELWENNVERGDRDNHIIRIYDHNGHFRGFEAIRLFKGYPRYTLHYTVLDNNAEGIQIHWEGNPFALKPF